MERTSDSIKFATPAVVNLCCDVGMADLHMICPALADSLFSRVFKIPNRTLSIVETLTQVRDHAARFGFGIVRVVVEPTGIYHNLLLDIARSMGMQTAMVNGEHVAKMRVVRHGDSGKTDKRDPLAISDVVDNGRIIEDRRRDFPNTFHLLRDWGYIYQAAEDGVIECKGKIHRGLKQLFPDFDFKKDFLFGPSGQAIMACYGFDPHEISRHAPSRLLQRLRKTSRIQKKSIGRLLASARASVLSTPDGERLEFLKLQLTQVWEEWEMHERRRAEARAMLESLYDRARANDPRLPEPEHGVITKIMLARLFAELGPIDDFTHWRQVLRYAGNNLRERESGKYVGQVKIARKGRPQLRRILNQIALPLVKKGCLFGDYFHQKRKVQKMPGPKAMTAVSRKIVKMIWGWYHSGTAFDAERVFTCRAAYCRNAA